jgi:sec-independent protein translocase protein TatC
MSFLEHLDELRKRLVRSAVAIAVAFVIGWTFSDVIFNALAVPVTAALREAKAAQQKRLDASGGALADAGSGVEIQYTFRAPVRVGDIEVPAGTTIEAKLDRDDQGAIVLVPTRAWGIGGRVFPEGQPIPLAVASGDAYIGPDDRLVIETVQGTFNLYVKVAFYTALVLAVPFLLFQLWGFVSPGLYAHERAYVWPFVSVASVCFGLGVFFAYEVAFPAACDYLIGLGGDNFRPLINADEYFDLILFIMLGLGLVFQIPTVTLLLSRLGLITAGTLIRVWRHAVLIIFVLAAVMSPTADIPNMLVFAAPMLALYVVSIVIAWFFHRRRRSDVEVEAANG